MFRKIAAAACIAAVSGAAQAQELTTTRLLNGLSLALYLTHSPEDPDRIYIVRQRGVINVYNLQTEQLGVFLDLTGTVSTSGNERGLFTIAFHPDFANNNQFFVNYTRNGGSHPTVVERYTAIDADTADESSAETVLTFNQDFSNHNGGWCDFGPDGMLYVATGDGGSGNDPNRRAQNLNVFLGKMLRLDVDGDDFPGDPNRNYAIPADNPFVGQPNVREEIWAYGLRNPWRCSFERGTGNLYIADVGQNAREEVDFQPASSEGGENYGWRCYEGNRLNIANGDCDPLPDPVVFPIHEYTHSGGNCSITGGYSYQGCGIPGLEGTYFFADVCSNQLWSFRHDGNDVNEFTNRTAELAPDIGFINGVVSFGEDFLGEMYIVGGGEVFKIVPAGGINDINGNGIEDACECLADLDEDGDVDADDFFAYLDLFASDDDAADLTGDGAIDSNDFFAYLDLFVLGCPG